MSAIGNYMNNRRIFLIQKKHEHGLNDDEAAELCHLGIRVAAYVDKKASRADDALESFEQYAKQHKGHLMDNSVKLLDHGFLRLVDSMGGDISVVRAARVSYDAAWRAGENQDSDAKLIRYLWKNHHTTPFESVTFTFEVKAPIFVFRQWHRHRTWSFNEISARYRELPEEFYVPDPSAIGIQSTSSKQAREIVDTDPCALDLLALQASKLEQASRDAFSLYRELLAAGWPRELARSILPVSTYSHMFGTVNLLNLLKFMTLRRDAHAQYEIRVYADAMCELIRPIVPVCVSAWEESFLSRGSSQP